VTNGAPVFAPESTIELKKPTPKNKKGVHDLRRELKKKLN